MSKRKNMKSRSSARNNRRNSSVSKRKQFIIGALIFVLIGLFGGIKLVKPSHAVDEDVYFKVDCSIDHYAPDDPIVFPGMPGASHMHSFYGNPTTNANSNLGTLLSSGGPSKCINGMGTVDKSSYWVPSLYIDNADGTKTLLNSSDQSIIVYYWKPPLDSLSGPSVQSIPNGLRMIAGDAKAQTPQSINIVQWDCGGNAPDLPAPPSYCKGGDANDDIHASLFFPNCWDGVHLDSADHKSHMAYSDLNTGACPADHPVHIPQVNFEVNYPYGSNPNLELSSGGVYSWHGDFVSAWDTRVMDALVGCINQNIKCGAVQLIGNSLIGETGYTINLPPATPPPPPPPTGGKVGDINGDGLVNITDLSILLAHWATAYPSADLDGNGTVGIGDMSILLSHYGT